MAEITIQKDELVSFLYDYLRIDDTKQKLAALRTIDWNPFDEDGDQYVGVWQEMQHNFELVFDVIKALVNTVERIIVGGVSLTSTQKRDAVVSALDKALKMPWYAEPFDGVALGMLVDMAVAFMNKVDWGIQSPQPLLLTAEGGKLVMFKEIG